MADRLPSYLEPLSNDIIELAPGDNNSDNGPDTSSKTTPSTITPTDHAC